MGTRWQAFFMDGDEHLCTLYGQWDGYPSGAGKQIKEFLFNGQASIINGIKSGQSSPEFFNGMGCLAAYLIGAFKDGDIGSYIMSADKNPSDFSNWTEFHYVISGVRPEFGFGEQAMNPVNIQVISRYTGSIYNGPLSQFEPDVVERRAFEDEEPEEEFAPKPNPADDIEINSIDLIIDSYPGGYVSAVDTGIKITHKPTGIVITYNEERSQLQNRMIAMAMLKSKLLDMMGDSPSLGGDRG